MYDPYTVASLAEKLGVSRAALYRILRKGAGPPTFRVGRRILIDREALHAWISGGGDVRREADESTSRRQQ